MKVFILSRNRPLYLWACLDSLFRLTRSPCQFTLIDSASDDPLVRSVIEGFERRGLIQETVWLKRNEAQAVFAAILERLNEADHLFAFIESDTQILPGPYECWLRRMEQLMKADPLLAMLGSFVDPADLVPMEAARRLEPQLTEDELSLLTHNKYYKPALYDAYDLSQSVISPHTPAGRLLMLRREVVARAGAASDSDLHDRLLAMGYRTGISTEVRHRHLTLCNIFDYPTYDTYRRRDFMYGYTYRAQVEDMIAKAEVATTDDSDVHVMAGAVRIDPADRDGDLFRFEIPHDAGPLILASRTGFAFGSADIRPLGVAVGRLITDGVEQLAGGLLVNGWYSLENGWRWTSGRAELPPCTNVEVQVVGTVTYILKPDE